MKVKNVLILSLFLLTSPFTLFAQSDSLGMLGDQLDLYGVLDLFKNSDNLEEFEKKLNSENNEVNNLDLNNDDKIDYIRVIDYKEGNGHAIVLQVPISETESQDVAVIELDNTSDGEAHIQIVGDEDLYGKNYIVEPLDNSNTVSNNNTTVVVNVWTWRPVRYFYGPHYRAWVSPWRWSYYPGWFKPWRPVGWYAYHPRLVRYHTYGRVVVVRRSPRIYTAVYAPRRVTSKVVINNRMPRANYYNRQNTGPSNTQGRQNKKQNAGQGQNNTREGSNYNEGRQKKGQENSQHLNQNKEQGHAERKQRVGKQQAEGGRQQRVKGEGRNQQRHAGGRGGGGRRGK